MVPMAFWILWRIIAETMLYIRNFKGTCFTLSLQIMTILQRERKQEQFSEYDKLAQKLETAVGDILVDKVREKVKEDGRKVITVTKKRLVKKTKSKRRG